MQFAIWEPIYQQILEDFGFSRKGDEEAAELLAHLLSGRPSMLPAAKALAAGKMAVICGNAPTLHKDLEIWQEDQESDAVILAADGATTTLMQRGILPHIVVTDLDGPFQDILAANERGCIVAVHAHGDNLDALAKYVPKLERIIGTVQCRPLAGLYNFGGFTDGDRCVFLARALGAASIMLLGFDYDDESVTPRKRKKLSWAKRLIELAVTGQ
jgi:uncharacterized Rossmann fold enzyme